MHHADSTNCASLHGPAAAPAVGEDMRKSCGPVPRNSVMLRKGILPILGSGMVPARMKSKSSH